MRWFGPWVAGFGRAYACAYGGVTDAGGMAEPARGCRCHKGGCVAQVPEHIEAGFKQIAKLLIRSDPEWAVGVARIAALDAAGGTP